MLLVTILYIVNISFLLLLVYFIGSMILSWRNKSTVSSDTNCPQEQELATLNKEMMQGRGYILW